MEFLEEEVNSQDSVKVDWFNTFSFLLNTQPEVSERRGKQKNSLKFNAYCKALFMFQSLYFFFYSL